MLKKMIRFTHHIETLATKTQLFFRLATFYYQGVIKRESILANITEDDHVLCVGGGICPFSAILIHKNTGAKVTVIDNDAQCVPKSQKFLEQLQLSDKINVCCQDGCNCQDILKQYTVVHLAMQVSPLENVFAHIEERVSSGTKILIRRPKKRFKKVYCGFMSGFLAKLPYITHYQSGNIGSTLLYTK